MQKIENVCGNIYTTRKLNKPKKGNRSHMEMVVPVMSILQGIIIDQHTSEFF